MEVATTSWIGERVPVFGLFASAPHAAKRPHDDSVEHAAELTKSRKMDDDLTKKRRLDTHCFSCQKKGGEPLCKTCFRVYHRYCASRCSPCDEKARPKSADNDTVCELIETVIIGLKEIDKEKVFHHAVDTDEYPDYLDIVVHPIDLTVMHAKAVNRRYLSLEEFRLDVIQLFHNSVVYNTTAAWVTGLAGKLKRRACRQLEEIEKCWTCFVGKSKDPNWFVKPCADLHLILWAKVRSYPFWPAKFIGMVKEQAEVMFFGDHSRALVQLKDCFLYGENLFQMGQTNRAGYEKKLQAARKELKEHCDLVNSLRGSLRLATSKIPFDPSRIEEQKKLMFDALSPDKHLQPRQERSELKVKECSIVLEKLTPSVVHVPEIVEDSVPCAEPENDSTAPDIDVNDESNPCITNVQTLLEPFPSGSSLTIENTSGQPSNPLYLNNDVSSSSDTTTAVNSFDYNLNICFQTLIDLTNEVVRRANQSENTNASTQTHVESGPVKAKIAVRRDLMSPADESSTSLLPAAQPLLRDFDINKMTEYAVREFETKSNREDLLLAVLELIQKSSVAHSNTLEMAKANFAVERQQLIAKVSMYQALANRTTNNLESPNVDESAENSMMPSNRNYDLPSTEQTMIMNEVESHHATSSNPLTVSEDLRNMIRCDLCTKPCAPDKILMCCINGSYCSLPCRSNDWIRHGRVCDSSDLVKTGIETAALSATDNTWPRRRIRKPRKSPNDGRQLPMSRTSSHMAIESGNKLTMAARKMMPANMEDKPSSSTAVSKLFRQKRDPNEGQGS